MMLHSANRSSLRLNQAEFAVTDLIVIAYLLPSSDVLDCKDADAGKALDVPTLELAVWRAAVCRRSRRVKRMSRFALIRRVGSPVVNEAGEVALEARVNDLLAIARKQSQHQLNSNVKRHRQQTPLNELG
jgi:hypothetical protein